jgi:ribosomal protein L37AE/L43A
MPPISFSYPTNCAHCFCKRTSGNLWYCCRCGALWVSPTPAMQPYHMPDGTPSTAVVPYDSAGRWMGRR